MKNNQTNDFKMIIDEAEPAQGGDPALSDLLLQLENYTPIIPDAVTAHFLKHMGCECKDPRILRLISIAGQKFISDIANDALQHCKMRSSNATGPHGASKSSKGTKDRRYCLTMEDLIPALAEFGIAIKKPHYYV